MTLLRTQSSWHNLSYSFFHIFLLNIDLISFCFFWFCYSNDNASRQLPNNTKRRKSTLYSNFVSFHFSFFFFVGIYFFHFYKNSFIKLEKMLLFMSSNLSLLRLRSYILLHHFHHKISNCRISVSGLNGIHNHNFYTSSSVAVFEIFKLLHMWRTVLSFTVLYFDYIFPQEPLNLL